MSGLADGRSTPTADVLLMGVEQQLRRRLERALLTEMRGHGMVRTTYASAWEEMSMERVAVVVFGASRPRAAIRLLARDPALSGRSLTFDTDRMRFLGGGVSDWSELETGALRLTAHAGDASVRAALAELLIGRPAARHLISLLSDTCPPAQLRVLTEFLIRTEAGTPRKMACALGRSRRSLWRDCAAVRLPNPQTLLRIARVSRGLVWAHTYRASMRQAAMAAGYAEPGSFVRAARQLFGLSPSALLVEWPDTRRLSRRFERVLAAS